MHGFTNFQQSKALYERGYRHPEPVMVYPVSRAYDRKNPYPAFSLADIVTMQGERFYMPPQVSMEAIIEYNMIYLIKQGDAEVQACNQRLREVYE
jgi:hypothetical protein